MNRIIDNKYSENICYEIGLNYFKLRKTFINNKDLFYILYNQTVQKVINNKMQDFYLDKLDILNKYIYVPNLNNETTLKGVLSNICVTTFNIVNYSKGSFIIIPFSWNYHLLIEPIQCKATEFINDELYNYIINNYINEKMTVIQYTKHSPTLSIETSIIPIT